MRVRFGESWWPKITSKDPIHKEFDRPWIPLLLQVIITDETVQPNHSDGTSAELYSIEYEVN